jgi:hypothetical protein
MCNGKNELHVATEQPSRNDGSGNNAKRSIRWDTIAAIASAISAIVSAGIAAYALSFLSRQEEIARNQLQATYLSNLYARQVDNFAALETALSEFYEQTGVLRISSAPKEIAKYQGDVTSNMDAFHRARSNLIRRWHAMNLTAPRSFNRVADEVSIVTNEILERASEFVQAEATQERFNAFNEEMKEGFRRLDAWYTQAPECVRNIFIKGYTITDEGLADCKFSGELSQWPPPPIFPRYVPPPK